MHLLSTEFDSAGNPVGTAALDSQDSPVTAEQTRHLAEGLEVTVFVGRRLVDYRCAEQPPQPVAGFVAQRH